MRLLLAPHALTDWNAQRRYQGHMDTALNTEGHRQAGQLARRLAMERIDTIHTSDLRRALETANVVSGPHCLKICRDARLRELHFGAWEGLTYDEVQQRYPELLPAWQANVPRRCPPGGETLTHLAERIASFLAALEDDCERHRTMLVVAHRGSLQVLLCLALGLPAEAWWKFRLEPASLSELIFSTDGAMLISFNDTHHLRETSNAR